MSETAVKHKEFTLEYVLNNLNKKNLISISFLS